MTKKTSPATRSPARKKRAKVDRKELAELGATFEREKLRLQEEAAAAAEERRVRAEARKVFLEFVRTEQTFEEARRMLERVSLKLANSSLSPAMARLMRQVMALKIELRDEEGRLEARAQGERR